MPHVEVTEFCFRLDAVSREPGALLVKHARRGGGLKKTLRPGRCICANYLRSRLFTRNSKKMANAVTGFSTGRDRPRLRHFAIQIQFRHSRPRLPRAKQWKTTYNHADGKLSFILWDGPAETLSSYSRG
jgi:hypothetical protein